MRKAWIPIVIVILAAGGGVGGYYYFNDTYHFGIVQQSVLYRSGLQGMRRFENSYRQYPFKSVINVQSEKDVSGKYRDQVAEEKKFCEAHQIRYFHIPMDAETSPTAEQCSEFIKIVSDPANQPALVHDSQGVVREGMVVAVWQIEKMGYSPEQALKEINWYGHEKTDALTDFIKNYKRLTQ
jgi:hypothetical protein